MHSFRSVVPGWCSSFLVALAVGAVPLGARERLPEIAPGVHAKVLRPSETTIAAALLSEPRRPAVVILHGLGGLRPVSTDEAEVFVARGYVALVLDYYGEVRWGGWSAGDRALRWRQWERTVAMAVAHVRAQSDVDPRRVVLVGISQGGALALTSATRIPGIVAVIDYFGPHPRGWYVGGLLGQRAAAPSRFPEGLPPVLILHGAWDPLVPASNSRRLHDELRAAGRAVELHVYPRTLHAFNDPDTGWSGSTVIADDARRRVFAFLAAHTGAP